MRLLLIFLGCFLLNNGYAQQADTIRYSVVNSGKITGKQTSYSKANDHYYHFEYNSDGRVTHTSIASGLETTNIIYEGDRISEVRSASVLDANHLKYLYNFQGQPNVINYVDQNGITQKRVVLDYDGPRLVNLERQVRINNSFVTDKVMEFEYYPDGNLSQLIHHFTIPGSPAVNFTDRFEQYDDKVNVDGFGLLHDEFFDHLF